MGTGECGSREDEGTDGRTRSDLGMASGARKMRSLQ